MKSLERIKSHMLDRTGSMVLDDEERGLLDKIDFCDNLLRRYARPDACQLLQKRFDISKSQAYNIINATQQLYGSVTRVDKEYYRNVLLDLSMKLFELSVAKKDMRSANMALKNAIEITGVNRIDPELPDVNAMKQHNYILNINLSGEAMPIDMAKLARLKDKDKMALVEAISGHYEEVEAELFKDEE